MVSKSLALGLLASLAFVDPASAQVDVKHILSLDEAKRVIDAAKQVALQTDAPCVVAVVDDGGWLIAQERMDGAPMLISVELAPGKARAAALFRKPTAALEKTIDGGRYAQLTAPNLVQMQGGVPLVLGGKVIGAVGVSADTPAHDQAIAEAAAKAMTGRFYTALMNWPFGLACQFWSAMRPRNASRQWKGEAALLTMAVLFSLLGAWQVRREGLESGAARRIWPQQSARPRSTSSTMRLRSPRCG